MIDETDFANSMQTLGWSTGAVQSFKQDAYGAALLLIHYIEHLTPAGRIAWVKANNRRSDIGQSGIQKTQEGFYLGWLNQLRMEVYGPSFDDKSVKLQPMRVVNPWSLSDAEFSYCMLYIKTGRAPDTAKFEAQVLSPNEKLVADKVEATLSKEAIHYLEIGAAAVGGQVVIGRLLAAKNSTMGRARCWYWLGSILSSYMDKVQLRDLTARYTVDENRRAVLWPARA